jgi:hypothetical protein
MEAEGDNGEAAADKVDEGCADLDRKGEKSGSDEKRRAAETANEEDAWPRWDAAADGTSDDDDETEDTVIAAAAEVGDEAGDAAEDAASRTALMAGTWKALDGMGMHSAIIGRVGCWCCC